MFITLRITCKLFYIIKMQSSVAAKTLEWFPTLPTMPFVYLTPVDITPCFISTCIEMVEIVALYSFQFSSLPFLPPHLLKEIMFENALQLTVMDQDLCADYLIDF